jgi:hypothetical protein
MRPGVVGCIGRRAPAGPLGPLLLGRPPGICGRGRWKIGLPGSGRPGAVRVCMDEGCPWLACDGMGRRAIGVPGCGAAGAVGAKYTGRGPVCGTIIRRNGTPDETGRGAGVCADGRAASPPVGGGGATVETDGRCATALAGGTAAVAGAECGGAMRAGVWLTGDATGGATGGAACGAAAGWVGAGGACTTCAAAAGAVLVSGGAAECAANGGLAVCWIAFSTSPGLEIFDRSILVLISSSVRAFVSLGLAASACPAKCWRTRSASSTSIELEWVFFSVTPTFGSASRMALLLTSSSLARSLIRIFCITPFRFLRRCSLGLHCSLTVVG